jgi:hypothetical protein
VTFVPFHAALTEPTSSLRPLACWNQDTIPLRGVAVCPRFLMFFCDALIPHAWIITEVGKTHSYCKEEGLGLRASRSHWSARSASPYPPPHTSLTPLPALKMRAVSSSETKTNTRIIESVAVAATLYIVSHS